MPATLVCLIACLLRDPTSLTHIVNSHHTDVHFKNQGLDLIEVRDNGAGISPANYASVALKHHTSKLSSYADIGSLETFGFRGEALASLCALSSMKITTCLQEDVPKGSRLSLETSGKLSGTSIVAAQRGTTVCVEKLFRNLPVRRRELERNIKREWHKVIALLNQYACIRTNTKFTVSQQPTKGRRIVLFSTKGNPTTRDNIINIFGAKTMSALVPLDMALEMQPSSLGLALQSTVDPDAISKEVRLVGHVSRPTHGDGRQTPDRQMFFINGRPCSLPQIAKTFNEVYKSYNSTQSPFIFANIQLDTHMYDVNVSPDKRTILLHDQNQLLDTIRTSLIDLFDSHDYTVPVSQLTKPKSGLLPVRREASEPPPGSSARESSIDSVSPPNKPSFSAGVSQTPCLRNTSSHSRVGGGKADSLLDQWVKRKTLHQHADGDIVSEDASDITTDEEEPHNSNPTETHGKEPTKRQAEDPVSISAAKAKGKSATFGTPHSSPSGSEEDHTTIPVVQPVKEAKQGSSHLTQGSPAKRDPEPASVIIGNPQSLSGSNDPYTGRAHHVAGDVADTGDEDSDDTDDNIERVDDDAESNEEDDSRSSDNGLPSFGTALSQRFAAGQRQDSGGTLQSAGGHRTKAASSSRNPQKGIRGRHAPAKRGGSPPEEDEESVDEDHLDREPNAELGNDSNQDDIVSTPIGPNPVAKQDMDEATVAKPQLQSLSGSSRRRDTTLQFVQDLKIDEGAVQSRMGLWLDHALGHVTDTSSHHEIEDIAASDAESKLSLIISKSDFRRMRVAGQFNMGFIIAVRPGENSSQDPNVPEHDELFIIDQHASDEKYNFERLQDTTVVQSQRLVHPKRLELTALEEEIVMQSTEAIEANGFKIEINSDGEWPVGSRCQLTALPLSRETTFNLADLEELISLLGDESSESKHIPRPSKVRKMFAMRACRSSIMIGKALTKSQMYTLVGHMGELDKPWNCPHGRPTMRHLCRMQTWDDKSWARDLAGESLASWKTYGRGY